MARIGISPVSTDKQDLERLSEYECERIFGGKHSGVSESHQTLIAGALDYIRDGDEVVVTRLDRLGRSLSSVLLTIEAIKEKGAHVCALDQKIDTKSDDTIAKVMVGILAVFTEMGRDFIKSRTSEGKESKVVQLLKRGCSKAEATKLVAGGRSSKMSSETKKAIIDGLKKVRQLGG